MVTAFAPQRSRPRLGPAASLTATARGLALAGLMLAELGLLAVLLVAVLLTAVGFGVLIVGNGGPRDHRIMLGLLLIGAGLGLGWSLGSGTLLGIRRLASLTRLLAAEWCGVPIAEPYQPLSAGYGELSFAKRLSWLGRDRATWRDLRWVSVNLLVGWIVAAASAALVFVGAVIFIGPVLTREIPPPAFPGNTKNTLVVLGLAMIATGMVAAPWLLRGYGLLASSLLAPAGKTELALRVRQLSQTRTEALDTGAAEIRRIERDLHDGAQARLVAMGMTLDAAGQIIAYLGG